MKDFKQTMKMSHGGHYCWGGSAKKYATGGAVATAKTATPTKKATPAKTVAKTPAKVPAKAATPAKTTMPTMAKATTPAKTTAPTAPKIAAPVAAKTTAPAKPVVSKAKPAVNPLNSIKPVTPAKPPVVAKPVTPSPKPVTPAKPPVVAKPVVKSPTPAPKPATPAKPPVAVKLIAKSPMPAPKPVAPAPKPVVPAKPMAPPPKIGYSFKPVTSAERAGASVLGRRLKKGGPAKYAAGGQAMPVKPVAAAPGAKAPLPTPKTMPAPASQPPRPPMGGGATNMPTRLPPNARPPMDFGGRDAGRPTSPIGGGMPFSPIGDGGNGFMGNFGDGRDANPPRLPPNVQDTYNAFRNNAMGRPDNSPMRGENPYGDFIAQERMLGGNQGRGGNPFANAILGGNQGIGQMGNAGGLGSLVGGFGQLGSIAGNRSTPDIHINQPIGRPVGPPPNFGGNMGIGQMGNIGQLGNIANGFMGMGGPMGGLSPQGATPRFYKKGGHVLKKSEGGNVKQEDKDFVSDQLGSVPKEMGLPISVYVDGKYNSDLSKKVIDNNFYEKLKENREDLGKEMGKEDDYSYKFPVEDYNYKDKSQGHSARSQAMKEAKGGWIQGAIKKPGALHKSLGVPAGKKIPAAKLEKASHASGKLGQRARMAMTLKGMK